MTKQNSEERQFIYTNFFSKSDSAFVGEKACANSSHCKLGKKNP